MYSYFTLAFNSFCLIIESVGLCSPDSAWSGCLCCLLRMRGLRLVWSFRWWRCHRWSWLCGGKGRLCCWILGLRKRWSHSVLCSGRTAKSSGLSICPSFVADSWVLSLLRRLARCLWSFGFLEALVSEEQRQPSGSLRHFDLAIASSSPSHRSFTASSGSEPGFQ